MCRPGRFRGSSGERASSRGLISWSPGKVWAREDARPPGKGVWAPRVCYVRLSAVGRVWRRVAPTGTLRNVQRQMKKRMFHCAALCGLAILLFAGADGRGLPAAETLAPGSGALLYEEPKFLTGAIYSLDRSQLLFRFKRVASRSGSRLDVLRDFTYPDGRPAARERVVYEGDALVSVELEELQIGAVGSARIRRPPADAGKGTIEFEYARAPGSRPRTSNETLRENTLIADMVGPFLKAHWDALARGEEVRCRYIVVPRRETVGFTFTRGATSTWRGQPVLTVRMAPTSPFVAELVNPLIFTIEQAPTHRVLQYVGRTTPKIQNGGKWKDLDALTVFDWVSAR